MLPCTTQLRVTLALSPELTKAIDEYAVPFEVSRSVFVEEAMWLYLNHLDKYAYAGAKVQSHNKEALTA